MVSKVHRLAVGVIARVILRQQVRFLRIQNADVRSTPRSGRSHPGLDRLFRVELDPWSFASTRRARHAPKAAVTLTREEIEKSLEGDWLKARCRPDVRLALP
ncbi:hypothetical protein BN2476_1090001 [Paraburkholderia piptadeniae]|uniref:Uncharacterized protein n=1 Tax=Paraburkholderia piptadeniae TaxID=1701573 RepID=A0A1N7SUL4_9BURK|nr:hypothetical protein BN2476_1090001 [Paraburkholderia piptadeniae]